MFQRYVYVFMIIPYCKNKNNLFKQFLHFNIIAVWMFILEMVTTGKLNNLV